MNFFLLCHWVFEWHKFNDYFGRILIKNHNEIFWILTLTVSIWNRSLTVRYMFCCLSSFVAFLNASILDLMKSSAYKVKKYVPSGNPARELSVLISCAFIGLSSLSSLIFESWCSDLPTVCSFKFVEFWLLDSSEEFSTSSFDSVLLVATSVLFEFWIFSRCGELDCGGIDRARVLSMV